MSLVMAAEGEGPHRRRSSAGAGPVYGALAADAGEPTALAASGSDGSDAGDALGVTTAGAAPGLDAALGVDSGLLQPATAATPTRKAEMISLCAMRHLHSQSR